MIWCHGYPCGLIMPNPFLSPEIFNPRLSAEVAAAYRRNVEVGLVDSASAGEVGVRSLADKIKENTASVKSKGGTEFSSLTGFDQIKNPDTRRAFETSFTATDQLFSHLNIITPVAEECVGAGIDLVALGTTYERMFAEGLQPEVVLSPVLDVNNWRMLYDELANTNSTISNHLRHGGLAVYKGVTAEWTSLVKIPEGVPVIPSRGGVPSWTLRLIPGTPSPTAVDVNHNYNQAVHPTLNEYLTLQATCLQAGQEPLDHFADTWLSGSYSIGASFPRAPTGYWYSLGGQVKVCWGNIDSCGSRLGSRLPVWG